MIYINNIKGDYRVRAVMTIDGGCDKNKRVVWCSYLLSDINIRIKG